MPKSIQIPPGTASDGLEITDDEFRIVKVLHPGMAVIPAIPLLFLTFVVGIMLWASIRDGHWFVVLFLVPFVTFWYGLAAVVRDVLFRRDEYRLSAEGITLSQRTLGSHRTRRIPLDELIDFRGPDSFAADDGPMTGVEAVGVGRNLWFDPRIDGVHDRLLVKRLNARLEDLRRRLSIPTPPPGNLADCRPCRLPSDSAWTAEPQPDGVVLQSCGTWPPGSVRRLVVANLTVTIILFSLATAAIVVIARQPPEMGRLVWLLLLLAIPLISLGLLLIAVFLIRFTAPLRVTRWRFSEDGVECEIRLLGLRRRWTFSHPFAQRLTVIDNAPSPWDRWCNVRVGHEPAPRNAFGLVATDFDGANKVWTLRGLTLGEALWIKGQIQSALPSVATEDGPRVGRDQGTAVRVPGQPVRLALCVECLEPFGHMTPEEAVGFSCSRCGAEQPRVERRRAARSPDRNQDGPPSAHVPAPSELPAEIDIERRDADGLHFSYLAVPPGPIRRHAPYAILLWSFVWTGGLLWMSREDWIGIPKDGLRSVANLFPLLMAALGLLIGIGIALGILLARITVDLNRERILVRWGWWIVAKQWEGALDEIEGFQIDRLTARVQTNGNERRFQRPMGTVIVAGRSIPLTINRNRTFIRAVIGLVRSKLKELRSHDQASTP